LIGNNATVIELGKDLTTEELMEKYGSMNVFIASRMHSAIFALNAGVPTIALAYQPKTTGTFKLLDLEAYAADITDFTEHWLYERLLNASQKESVSLTDKRQKMKSDLQDLCFRKSVNHIN
jgi:colanic acid/amylovoran biosynthesis protein